VAGPARPGGGLYPLGGGFGPLPGLDVLLRWLTRPKVALAITLVGAVVVLLIKFPLAKWNQLIFFDDYPTIYYGSVRGLQTLAQGGVFGWDTRLLGATTPSPT